MSSDLKAGRCEVCGHEKSQHLAYPRMCADCAREDRPNAFHDFAPASHPPTQPTQENGQ